MEKEMKGEAVNAAVKSIRAMQAEQYGMWFKEDATASEMVSWCDGRIAKYTQWIQNCKNLKQASQNELLAGVSEEALKAALYAIEQQKAQGI